MKQRERLKLLERRHAASRAVVVHVGRDIKPSSVDRRSKMVAIYAHHKALFKRLEEA